MSIRTITDALCAPFEPRDVKFKPQMVKNNKALAIAYVDVRLIEDRLDDVMGVENWQDDYEILNDGSVTCRLRVKLGDQWVTKMDVGSPSEQPDGGDRLKAAFSDALKRTAVKFGIGRYLYRLPAQWVDYDPVKKQITRPPQLPAFAIPQKPQAEPPADKPRGKKAAPDKTLPADGAELHRRLQDKDAKLAAEGLCDRGALLVRITNAGVVAGYPADIREWNDPAAIAFAARNVIDFEAAIRATTKPQE